MAITVEATGSPAAWEQAKREIDEIAVALAGGARLRRAGPDPRQGIPRAAISAGCARGELDAAFERRCWSSRRAR
jgi:hypothetical protein